MWIKLDDQFFSHPKVIEAGRDGRDLYLAALCYCGMHLTDGRVPRSALALLAGQAGVRKIEAAVSSLLTVGLWEEAGDGNYRVHDYLDHQPSKERVLATREVRAQAGSRGGKQKASNLLEVSQRFAKEIPKQNASTSRIRERDDQERPPPTPPNGHAPCAYAEAVGEEKFRDHAAVWAGLNVDLGPVWFRKTLTALEGEYAMLDPPQMQHAFEVAYRRLEQALRRDTDHGIKHIQGFAASKLREALAEQKERVLP